jgi:uncharacterized protein YxjI
MRYYMKSKFFKLKEDFWIKNEFDEECFFVDNKFISLGLQFDILKNNNIIYSAKQRLLSFMANYEVFEGGNIIANVSQKLTFFSDKLKVDSKYGEIKIQGDIFHYNYTIVKDDRVIARATRELFAFTDNYTVDIDFEDEAFILSLVVIIDDIIDRHKSN